jgi:hypothetical protein
MGKIAEKDGRRSEKDRKRMMREMKYRRKGTE